MLEINNTRVYGLEESIISSGYPMIAEEIGEWDDYAEDFITEKDIKRAIKLGNTPQGSGHSNYLKGIIVQFDVKYPNYWTPEFQRYNFADIISSTSKMHRLTKMNVKEMCNEYVDDEIVEILENKIDFYNDWVANKESTLQANHISLKEWNEETSRRFMKIISNTPMGLEQTMRISTNYLQLRTIYNQRRNHKLKDWRVFCDWCETLPYFKEFCLGGING